MSDTYINEWIEINLYLIWNGCICKHANKAWILTLNIMNYSV